MMFRLLFAGPVGAADALQARSAGAQSATLSRRDEHTIEQAGLPWRNGVAFVAAVGVVLVVMLILGTIMQFANPPRLEAHHTAFPTAGPASIPQRMRSQRRVSQAVRPPSGRNQIASSPSQIGLLDQAQPQPLTSRRARKEGRVSRQLPAPPPQHLMGNEPSPYMEIQMPPVARGQPVQSGYQDYTTGQYRHGPPRALPAPPAVDWTGGRADVYSAPYGDYSQAYGTHYAEMSPFESHEALTQSSTKATPRSSRGYVAVHEPSSNMSATQNYTDYAYPLEPYYEQEPQYQDHQPQLNHKASTRSRNSQLSRNGSQLSRVDSIGAGDYRRHSRKLPQPPNGKRMTTAERIQALRTAKQDVSFTAEPRMTRKSRDLPEPPMDDHDLYAMDAMQYPVRDEHRYTSHYGNRHNMWSSGQNEQTYYRYNPI